MESFELSKALIMGFMYGVQVSVLFILLVAIVLSESRRKKDTSVINAFNDLMKDVLKLQDENLKSMIALDNRITDLENNSAEEEKVDE